MMRTWLTRRHSRNLDRAITNATEAVRVAPLDDPELADHLSALRQLLLARFEHHGATGDLDQAIVAAERAVAATPARSAAAGDRLFDLLIVVLRRYERLRGAADLDRAVDVGEQVLAATPRDHPESGTRLRILRIAPTERYRQRGDPADLDRMITVGDRLAGSSRDPQDLLGHHLQLADALFRRYGAHRRLPDLDRVIEIGEREGVALLGIQPEQVVELPADGEAERFAALSILGSALRLRYERTGRRADLDRAVDVGEQAIARHEPSLEALSNFGIARWERCERSGNIRDLERAIEVGRRALLMSPPDGPRRAEVLANLCLWLRSRYARTGQPADLDEAIAMGERAVAGTPPEQPFLVNSLSNLAIALLDRDERLGGSPDLERATELLRRAVAAVPDDDGARATAPLANLANALYAQYLRAGSAQALDHAIHTGDQAIAGLADDHPMRTVYLFNQCSRLRSRYQRIGALADLHGAIEIAERALTALDSDHPERPLVLATLGSALTLRYLRLRDRADLDRAIDVGGRAMADVPPDHPKRGSCLADLALAHRIRFVNGGEPDDVDRAIELLEQASGSSAGRPESVELSLNLGIALAARAQRTAELTDLDRGLVLLDQVVADTPAGHPRRSVACSSVGLALTERFAHTGHPDDLSRAARTLREAAAVETAPALTRAADAARSGQVAARGQDWPAAAEAYATAIDLMLLAVSQDLLRADQEFFLSVLPGLGSAAAACFLQCGQIDRAVETWEHGRAVLLNQALQFRGDLALLAQRRPDLAAEFRRLRGAIDAQARSSPGEPAAASSLSDVRPSSDPDEKQALAGDFARLLAEIRTAAGFSRFLLPPSVDELLTHTGEGPIVLINVNEIRSDALTLTAQGIVVEPLPSLTPEAVEEAVAQLLTGLELRDGGAGAIERRAAEDQIDRILGWLWDTVGQPVLERSPSERGTRLWWCPSGLLALLPLHAAGHHARRGEAVPPTVLDRAVSSYTPTVEALGFARRRTGQHSRDPVPDRILAVSMPQTPGTSDLPAAATETRMLAGLFAGRTTTLTGAGATFDSVASSLRSHQWAHFACHAASDLSNPSTSHLLLNDHRERPFTVAALSALQLDHAELAFLSACESARTGLALPDEAIHLAAGCQLAGFRRVIATVWPIHDQIAARVAAEFYAAIADRGVGASAVALHETTLRRRERAASLPSTWAGHVHLGA